MPAPQPRLPYDDERATADSATRWSTPPTPVDGVPRADVEVAGVRTPRARGGGARSAGVQGTLALAFPLARDVPAMPTPSPRLRMVGRDIAEAGQLPVAGMGVAAARRPTATRWAAVITQAIVEAEHGDRPLSQLARWTSEDVYDAVAARLARNVQRSGARHSARRAIVSSLHVCPVADDVVEACATVRWDGRARAIAVRLESTGSTWRCTAISLG